VLLEFGVERAGIDVDDAEPRRLHLEAQHVAEHRERGLAPTVDPGGRDRHPAEARDDVDDPPVRGGPERRKRLADEQERGERVDLEEASDALLGGLLEEREVAHAGVVDQQVDAPVDGRRLAGKPLRLAGPREIGGDRRRRGLRLDLLQHALEVRFRAAREDEKRSPGGEELGQLVAEATGGPGEEDDSIAERLPTQFGTSRARTPSRKTEGQDTPATRNSPFRTLSQRIRGRPSPTGASRFPLEHPAVTGHHVRIPRLGARRGVGKDLEG
jgi:hypothetical protein